jgi:hypothetical protein
VSAMDFMSACYRLMRSEFTSNELAARSCDCAAYKSCVS